MSSLIDGAAISDSVAQVVERASSGVVRVDGHCNGGGTGAVWSSDGVVVTAHHALDRDDDLTVTTADGRSLKASVVGRDPSTDVAVLRVDAADLPPLAWSDGEGMKVGHCVVTLGRPGRSVRATFGVIQAVGEGFRTPAGGAIDRFIEVDANLPRGFSGGPLIDLGGRVLGINTAGLMRGGATVPTPTLRRVVGDLLAHGRISRGYLGVSVYPVRLSAALAEKLSQRFGLVVVGVEPGSPGEVGGILQGDTLITIDGHALEHPRDLVSALDARVGVPTAAKLIRAGDPRDLVITTGVRP